MKSLVLNSELKHGLKAMVEKDGMLQLHSVETFNFVEGSENEGPFVVLTLKNERTGKEHMKSFNVINDEIQGVYAIKGVQPRQLKQETIQKDSASLSLLLGNLRYPITITDTEGVFPTTLRREQPEDHFFYTLPNILKIEVKPYMCCLHLESDRCIKLVFDDFEDVNDVTKVVDAITSSWMDLQREKEIHLYIQDRIDETGKISYRFRDVRFSERLEKLDDPVDMDVLCLSSEVQIGKLYNLCLLKTVDHPFFGSHQVSIQKKIELITGEISFNFDSNRPSVAEPMLHLKARSIENGKRFKMNLPILRNIGQDFMVAGLKPFSINQEDFDDLVYVHLEKRLKNDPVYSNENLFELRMRTKHDIQVPFDFSGVIKGTLVSFQVGFDKDSLRLVILQEGQDRKPFTVWVHMNVLRPDIYPNVDLFRIEEKVIRLIGNLTSHSQKCRLMFRTTEQDHLQKSGWVIIRLELGL